MFKKNIKYSWILIVKQLAYSEIKKTLHIHASLITIVSAFFILCVIVADHFGQMRTIFLQLWSYTLKMAELALFFLSVLIGWRAVLVMFCIRPKHLIKSILSDLREQCPRMERVIHGLPIIIILPIFFSAFSTLKIIIPLINPFCCDQILMRIDKAIHFGYHPWVLLQPILGYPFITAIIDWIYFKGWFLAIYASFFWQAFNLRNPKLRMKFFLSCFCIWTLLGIGAAIPLSSAGPCYYDSVTGLESPFRQLIDYLTTTDKSISLWVIYFQEYLWFLYKNNLSGFGSGISAAPSMHVAMAFLVTLNSWYTNSKLGIASAIFLIIILAGSVHLGWHYAIDGYISIVGTWLIWYVVGVIMRINSVMSGTPRTENT